MRVQRWERGASPPWRSNNPIQVEVWLLIGKWFEAVHANQGKIRGEGKLKYQEREHSGDKVVLTLKGIQKL